METRKAKTVTVAMVVLCACGILTYALIATGDSLEPTMHTLDEIDNLTDSQVQKPQAFDCFLSVDGIPGESIDPGHEEWIDLLAYSHGVSQPGAGSRSTGGAHAAGRCEHNDFTVVKTLDKTSPRLALYCCQGKHISTVVVELCMAWGDKQKFMEYTLSNVIITTVNPSTYGAMLSDRPIEEVSFNYGKIEWKHFDIDPATGTVKGTDETHWDLMTNKGG